MRAYGSIAPRSAPMCEAGATFDFRLSTFYLPPVLGVSTLYSGVCTVNSGLDLSG